MNEETRIKPPEANTEALNDEKLEETAGGAQRGKDKYTSLYGRCAVCGRMNCLEHSLRNERAPWG